MNELEVYEQFEKDIQALADKYSIERLKVSTINFDRDFRRGVDGNFSLVSTKAVIRVLGKTSKVPIGEGLEHETYDEAYSATKEYWSEYYKGVRARRSPSQLKAEALRQKRYRERRKQLETEQMQRR